MLHAMAQRPTARAIGLLAALAAGMPTARAAAEEPPASAPVAVPAPAAPAPAAPAAQPAPAPAATPAPVAPPVSPPATLTGNVIITLTNGDTFHATIVSDADPMVIEHALIGRMSIARERVKDIQKEPPPATPAPGAPPATRSAHRPAHAAVSPHRPNGCTTTLTRPSSPSPACFWWH